MRTPGRQRRNWELGAHRQISKVESFVGLSAFPTVSPPSAPSFPLPPFPISPYAFTSFPSLPFFPFPIPNPFLPLPLITARWSGEHYCSPSGSGQSPAVKHFCAIHCPKSAILLQVSPTSTRRPHTINSCVNCDYL